MRKMKSSVHNDAPKRLPRAKKKVTKIGSTKPELDKIYIQIASYRDPELLPTIIDCLENAQFPERLVFGIAWQHNPDDAWDNLDAFKNDPRFKIIDINYKDSQGACYARHLLNKQWSGEKYTLQLDSHHRFVKHWDTGTILMYQDLQKQGYEKPLLTAYIPSYDPDKDPESRVQEPWELTFDRFIPEGAIFMLPQTMRGWKERTSPMRGRYLSAHFVFTLGKICEECPYDPEYYFHGEEISMAVRAFTHGYDIFYPHKIIAWHEYTRKGRTKQWDDDPKWGEKNNRCHEKNRQLFGMDGNPPADLGIYGFGSVRSLEDYEKYAGISFSRRAVQQETLDNKETPNTQYATEEEYQNSFLKIFKHCVDIAYNLVPHTDYDFWAVAFSDEDGKEIYRQDADAAEITRMKSDPDGYCKLWRTFMVDKAPKTWVVWPHSIEHGWGERLTGNL